MADYEGISARIKLSIAYFGFKDDLIKKDHFHIRKRSFFIRLVIQISIYLIQT
ncbi:hypothetical protein Cycma_4416 [Cyclobacterium marinum DSM 745]|uniref:Uncharacterized protein n=1 Tax=Cyclobacterium marinum (strain ATCC 25205 / DSM 745 / LMG 13164 / NCIMB 1802) TaxID=880070 RepID=G0IYX3_CYCMS|nr:hypothetical protein Cycma_4416 [Cyclobacterium marinum DSM 745]